MRVGLAAEAQGDGLMAGVEGGRGRESGEALPPALPAFPLTAPDGAREKTALSKKLNLKKLL